MLHVQEVDTGSDEGDGAISNIFGFACKCNDGAVVVSIRLDTQNGASGDVANGINDTFYLFVVAAFGDVWNTFNQLRNHALRLGIGSLNVLFFLSRIQGFWRAQTCTLGPFLVQSGNGVHQVLIGHR